MKTIKESEANVLVVKATAFFKSIHTPVQKSVRLAQDMSVNITYLGICVLHTDGRTFWLYNRDWRSGSRRKAIEELSDTSYLSDHRPIIQCLVKLASQFRKEMEEGAAATRGALGYLRKMAKHYSKIELHLPDDRTKFFDKMPPVRLAGR